MHVAGPQPDPVHRREVADGVGRVGVLDELRRRRRARREVEQQRSRRPGCRTPADLAVEALGVAVAAASRRRRSPTAIRVQSPGTAANRAASAARATTCRTFPRSIRSRTSAGASSVVAGITHGAEPDRGEHRLPQLDLVAEHEQHAVAAPHALRGEPPGEPARPAGQLGEGQLAARRRPAPGSTAPRRSAAGPAATTSNQSRA